MFKMYRILARKKIEFSFDLYCVYSSNSGYVFITPLSVRVKTLVWFEVLSVALSHNDHRGPCWLGSGYRDVDSEGEGMSFLQLKQGLGRGGLMREVG